MPSLWTGEQARNRHPVLAFFARRPITVAVLLVAIAVLGMISMGLMPLELFPGGLERRSLSVEVEYVRGGGTVSPMVVERDVTLIVEGELSTIPGVKDLTAVSRGSGADFSLDFDRSRDMAQAYAEVWAAVERARLRLPDTVGRISVRRFGGSSGSWPVAFVNFSWDATTQDPHLKLERVIQPHLESIDGIGSVTFFGSHRKYVAVDLDPEKSRAYGVNLAELLQRLRGDNFRAPAGKVTLQQGAGDGAAHDREVYIVADSRFGAISEIENIPVRPGLALVDITRHGVIGGRPHRGVYETYSVSSEVRVNRQEGATAMVFKTSDSNTVQVGDRLVAALEQLRADPQLKGFDSRIAWNQGEAIRESINNLLWTLLWGGLLAFTVMLLFLKSWRLSLMIALSIPLSMTMALGLMFLMDQTINVMLLMGLTLAAGMLLDNSIVVAENVFRRNLLGEEPYAAAVRGAGEVGLALLLATSTTVIVFITVVFMLPDEMLSFLMGKIGLPVCLSLGFSIVLALGVIPVTMYRAGLLRSGKTSRFRAWFAGLRLPLTQGWRRGGTAALLALPGIIAWEICAFCAGRNATGLPSTPVMDRAAAWYERAIRRVTGARYLVAGACLALTAGGVWMLYVGQQRTDENQGNRDRIQVRVGFEGGSDVVLSRRALQITAFEPESSAENAGLRVGDFILRYNSRAVQSLDELRGLESQAPPGTNVRVDIARGRLSGWIEVAAGPLGIDGAMEDTQPLRDAVAGAYVRDVETMLLGNPDAHQLRERAVRERKWTQEQAQAAFGRTPQEAKEYFGVEDLSLSYSASRANFWIYIDPQRVDQANAFYKRIMQSLPDRAGVQARGEFQGGGSSNGEVTVRINGPDTERLLTLADDVVARLSVIDGLEGLRIDTQEGMDEVTVGVDRQRAAAFGVEPNVLSQVIGFQLSGTMLRDYQHGRNLLPLRVRFANPDDKPGLQDVAETRVITPAGGTVAAKAVTSTSGLARSAVGEIRRINRRSSLRVVGTTSTEDLERIQSQVRATMQGVNFPPGYGQELGGRFANLESRFADIYMSLVWSAVLVFLVMCFLFESVLKPMCILLASVPGAMLGGFGLLQITNTPVDGLTMLGLLVLVGVVVNNGIVLVDLINRLRAEGLGREAAVQTAARQRLRPILLTSLTTAFGLIPMAIGDAQFVGMPYYPLGRMVLGGILVSMVYTLVLVPLLYTILDDVGVAIRNWAAVILGESIKGGGQAAAAAPASAE